MDMEFDNLRIWILKVRPHVLMVKDDIDCRKRKLTEFIYVLLASDRVFKFLWQNMLVRSVSLIALTLLFLSCEEFIGRLILDLVGLSVIIV